MEAQLQATFDESKYNLLSADDMLEVVKLNAKDHLVVVVNVLSFDLLLLLAGTPSTVLGRGTTAAGPCQEVNDIEDAASRIMGAFYFLRLHRVLMVVVLSSPFPLGLTSPS